MVCVSAAWSAVLSDFARAVWTGAMECCDVCAAVSSVEKGFWVCGSEGGSSRARFYLQVRRAKGGSPNEGQSIYSNMARVARVLLSVPASSAILEREFSTAGRLITGSRSSLSVAYAEMDVFLNGNIKHIPIDVPAFST